MPERKHNLPDGYDQLADPPTSATAHPSDDPILRLCHRLQQARTAYRSAGHARAD